MKNAVPVSAITLENDEQKMLSQGKTSSSHHLWIEVLTVGLMCGAVFVGLDFWTDWFSSVDRIICSFCVLVGLIVAMFRSNWHGELSWSKLAFAILLWCLAGVMIWMSFTLGRHKLSGIACGFALAAWCSVRILGERLPHSLSLGLVFAIPSMIDAFDARGAFEWLESTAITVTSGLADAAEQSHVREGDLLLFGLGTADKFSCVGKWDSVVSFVGIAVFCVLAFRRNLVSGAITIASSAIVWIAVRGTAWVTMAWLSNQHGAWYDWSVGLEMILFIFGAILVVSIDQFFAALLEPIPFEFVNTDFPLFAFVWNWVCGLPALKVSVPQRESDFGQLEMEA